MHCEHIKTVVHGSSLCGRVVFACEEGSTFNVALTHSRTQFPGLYLHKHRISARHAIKDRMLGSNELCHRRPTHISQAKAVGIQVQLSAVTVRWHVSSIWVSFVPLSLLPQC